MNIAAYSKYASYRDSGVLWIGETPSGWDLTRLGSLFAERKEKVSDSDFEPLSVTKNGIFPQLETAAKTNDGDNRKLVKAGDFVINSRSDRKGSSGVSPLDGSVSLINIVLEPKCILPEFCNHLLKSYTFVEEYYRVGRGIVADLWTTRFDEMRTILVALPSPEEQRAIAAFLDKKCTMIDEAVRIKEDQIKLLHERRQVLIQQAMTCGLDPDVPMKDSGIDWIGEIPLHWHLKRLRHAAQISPSRRVDGNMGRNDQVVFLPMEAIGISGGVRETFICSSKEVSEGFTYFQRGDVIMAKITPCFENGKGAFLEGLLSEYGFGTTELHVLRPKEITGRFLYYFISRSDFRKRGEVFMVGSAGQKRVSTGYLKDQPIPVPPINEQQAIVSFLDNEGGKIDKAISIKQDQIASLKEYRTSLISAAVTGKIKVI